MTEQKIENCPFCGGECYSRIAGVFEYNVRCMMCGYESGESPTAAEAEDAHNRVSLAAQMFNTMCKSDAESRERFFKAKRDLDAMG